MFGTVHFCIALLVPMAPVPKVKAMEPSAFLKACRDQEAALVAFFSDESVWRPERKAELLVRLQVVGVVRPKVIVPKLLAHLDYYDDTYEIRQRLPAPEWEYPVYGALKKYGAAIIPELIAYLKKTDPPANERKARIEAYLSLLLLRELSDEKGVGKAMARARIQHELDQFPQADFPRLKTLLSDPLLR